MLAVASEKLRGSIDSKKVFAGFVGHRDGCVSYLLAGLYHFDVDNDNRQRKLQKWKVDYVGEESNKELQAELQKNLLEALQNGISTNESM